MVNAIDPEYLYDLRDVHTFAITDSIPDIMSHLTKTYGDLSYQDLLDKEDDLNNSPC